MGKPVPCAANQGTQITVEDLFFNVPTRKRALKSHSEEFQRVADVVSKVSTENKLLHDLTYILVKLQYAIHNSGLSFSLKKQGEQTLAVRTQKGASVCDNVGVIFGHTIAKELIQVEGEDTRYKFKVKGWISNVNFSAKKFNFLLFINNRLVECSALKKAIEIVYSAYLPKESKSKSQVKLKLT